MNPGVLCLFCLSYPYTHRVQDLLDALNQLDVGLKQHIKTLSSFDKYKQEVFLGHLDWYPMHKDPGFWRENITNFEENDFQVCHPTALTVEIIARGPLTFTCANRMSEDFVVIL